MADMDMAEMMGFSGFGKKQKQKQLDPNRFEKNKREDVVSLGIDRIRMS